MQQAIPGLVPDTLDVDASLWLAAASQAIRTHCGWHISPNIERTLTLDADGGDVLLLPSLHVTDLIGVTTWDGRDITDHVEWSERGILRIGRGTFPDRLRGVTVTMRDGYEPGEIPDIQAICLNMARRASTGPGVIGSQSVNGASMSFLTAGGAPLSIPLLTIEKNQLEPYRIGNGLVHT